MTEELLDYILLKASIQIKCEFVTGRFVSDFSRSLLWDLYSISE
jgi:hypothetical protein